MSEQLSFSTPVVLFIFRRSDTVLRIIDVLREVRPSKIYLLSDEGRNDEERKQVREARASVEAAINWECTIVKRYAEDNMGVLNNIGYGARWVFERETRAIFLEDDNLPARSFFRYCQEMLDRYEYDNRVLWVCGTNYMSPEEQDSYGYSYYFSQHMLPCGWASWSNKFLKYYDAKLDLLSNEDARAEFLKSYRNKSLASEQYYHIEQTRFNIKTNIKRASWDYQMLFSLRIHHMYGIVPVNNQIRNIGVDSFSEHGGTSLKMPMTARFCEKATSEIVFPLKHPRCFTTPFERNIDQIILPPVRLRLTRYIGGLIKRILGMNPYESLNSRIRGSHDE